MRFIILGDDRASGAFNKFARNVDKANGAVDRNSRSLGAQGKAANAAQGGLLALTGTLTGFGDASTAASKKSSYFARGLAALNIATGVGESSVSALIGTVGALSASLVGAGIGLGAYGLVLKNVGTQLQKLKQLQTAAATGSKPAQKALQAFVKTLSPALKQFAGQLEKTKQQYSDWGKSLEKPVLAPLAKGLKLVKPLLHDLTPFVKAAADAIGILIDKLGRGIKSTGFHEWLATLLPLVKPTIVGLGTAIGNLAVGLGGILKAFAPFSKGVVGGIVKITAKFREWASDLDQHSGFKALVQQWKQNWPLVREGLTHLLKILTNILRAMAGMATPANSRALWQIANPLLTLAEKLSAHPQLVTALLYLTLIGKGAGQIGGVFKSMQSGWGSLSRIVSSLSGGKINLGMQTAGDTMLAASRNMQVAADTMAGASGIKGGAVRGGVGAAEGAAAGAGGAGILRRFLGGGLKWVVRGGIAVATVELLVKPILQSVPSGKGGNWWDNPGGILRGLNSWREVMKSAGTDLSIVGRGLSAVTGGLRHAGETAKAAGGHMKSMAQPVNDLAGKMAALGRAGNPVASMFGRQAAASKTANTALNNYTSAIHTNGLRSDQAKASRRTLLNDLISAGVKGTTARKDVAAYTEAIRKNGYGSDQAKAARQRLMTDITTAFKRSQQGKADMLRYTDAIRINGQKSDVTRAARARLIKDLEKSGADSRTAHRLVDGLSTGIRNIPNKHSIALKFGVNVPRAVLKHYPSAADMRAAGFAAGGRIHGPGGPTSDQVPLWGSAGEWVVRAKSARGYGDKAMRSVNEGTALVIPKYAAGGQVEPGPALGRQLRSAPGATYAAGEKPTETFGLKLWQVWIDSLMGNGPKIVQYALKFLHKIPYVWGGMSLSGAGADCSGFVKAIYQHFGINAPRTSEAQGAWVKRGRPQAGGLAFYNSPAGGPPPGHVAIVATPSTVISQGGGMGPVLMGLHGMPFMFAGTPPGGFGRGGSGATYRENQLSQLWISAGGPGGVAHLMAAIAMAESGGHANAVGPATPFGRAKGLWQILGLPFPGNPFNPLTNARMALSKYRSQGLGAWAAYTNGSYQRFMAQGGPVGGARSGWGLVGERGPELVRFRGGETVLPHSTTRQVTGYARGTKDTIAEQVHKALRVMRRRPHLPVLIDRLHKRLSRISGRIGDERQLLTHLHGARRRQVERELHRDEHHRRLMRRRLHDATHDRGIVEHAGHSLAARDRRLVDAIAAAHRRHMPKIARRLQHQLGDDKTVLHRLHRWLSQVARERARRAKEQAARKAAAKAAADAAKAARANNKVIRAYIRLSGAGWSAQARQAAAAALGMTGPVVFDRGGWLMPGATLAVNNTRRPEPVGAPGGHVTYNITVNVPPHANQASIGRQIVHSIQQFEKSSGTRWRT